MQLFDAVLYILLQLDMSCVWAVPSHIQVCATGDHDLPCKNFSIASHGSLLYREFDAYPLRLHKHFMLTISICNKASCRRFQVNQSE